MRLWSRLRDPCGNDHRLLLDANRPWLSVSARWRATCLPLSCQLVVQRPPYPNLTYTKLKETLLYRSNDKRLDTTEIVNHSDCDHRVRQY